MSIANFILCMPLQLKGTVPNIWEDYVDMCKKMGIDRIFCCGTGAFDNPDDLRDALRERITWLAARGIKAGAWLGPTLGWTMSPDAPASPYQQICDPNGNENKGISCPLDPGFQKELCDKIAAMAASGVDMILLEDDFRLQLHPHGPGCFCPLHMERFVQETGCMLTREAIATAVTQGEPNGIRSEWMRVAGRSLIELAQMLEKAVHEQNPDCRLGFAAVMTHYSGEGIDFREMIEALSGDTKPFLRTIGAPYWSNTPYHAGFLTEYNRLQKHLLQPLDIEMMAECDSYPHSSFLSPTSSTLGFLQGLIAAGFHGALVYPHSYALPVPHDPACANRIIKALPHLQQLAKLFPVGGEDLGVVPVETLNNYDHLTLPIGGGHDGSLHWTDEPYSLHVLSRMGIPVAFDKKDSPVVLFGYGARRYDDETLYELLGRGAIIDGAAAHWLVERGIDIGLTRADATGELADTEEFIDPDMYGKYAGDRFYVCCGDPQAYYRTEWKENAKVLSWYYKGKDKLFPSAIHYENGGTRVCILPVNMQRVFDAAHTQVLYSYPRMAQLSASLEWVSRKALDVYVPEQPNLHVLARRYGRNYSILLQNGWNDPIENPLLVLPASVEVDRPLVLGHEAQRLNPSVRYDEWSDEVHRYVRLHLTIPPCGAVAVKL